MWTLLFLCGAIVAQGVHGQWWTTAGQWWTTAGPSCGGFLYGTRGSIQSPGYPNQYPSNSDCVWYIRVGNTGIIQLDFLHVNLEGDFNCRYDSISVYNGRGTTSRLLGKLCGQQNTTFHSTSGYMTIRFRSDGSSNYKGFQAQYHVVGEGSCRYNCGYQVGNCSCQMGCEYQGNCCPDYFAYGCNIPTTPAVTPTTPPNTPGGTLAPPSCLYNCGYHLGSCSCSSSCQYYGDCCPDYGTYCQTAPPPTAPPTTPSPVPACGGSLQGSGSITSPNYPGYYHDNAYCVWYLTASYDQRVVLSFTDLQMERCCQCDYIQIYDGPYVNSRLLGTVCDTNNSTLNTFYSSSNHMTVVFRSDSSVVGRGFRAEFSNSLSPSSGHVDCSTDNMNIVISRHYLNSIGYDGHNLYLNDQYCRPVVNRYEVVFRYPINTCGNVRKFENGRVVYYNAIRAYSSNAGEITRQSHFTLNVSCRMERDMTVQNMYEARAINNTHITGTGRFNGSMAFYTSGNFYYEVTEVPYKVTLNQQMFVKVKLRRSDSTLMLFLDSCVASPSPHDDFTTRPYDLIHNGCATDSTVRIYSPDHTGAARFTFRAFQFLRAHESVYLRCNVLICPAAQSNSRCRQGCQRRKARDLGSAHESHTLVLGPIQLKELEKLDGGKEKVQAEVKA